MQWEPSGPTRARCGAASASRVAWQQVSWATLDAEPGQRQRAGKPRPPGAMAKKPMSTAEAERMNLVAQDQIWRCRLKAETEARQNWAQNWGFLATPLEEVLPSPPVPKTTQGFIGWRSGVPGLNKCLQQYDELRSCKGAYARELGWPEQGIH
ncbi:ciliary microtubule inner protein 1 isoform X2 [Desmodus rotundus]|uniref:ciliary microtubule inner protein 1 isoform X2 n=1 Tax=Desmodus rotundus TaxID=9430 RepID=UPI002380E188|nr:uncharacterized protein C20orf85 homolog isoform X2 [Desmodus rotundus]